MQTPAVLLLLGSFVAVFLVSCATGQPWIVRTTYLNDVCREQAPLGLSTLTSMANDSCIPTGPAESRRFWVYESSLYSIIYSNRNCSGSGSPGSTASFFNGTCSNMTTQFTGSRSTLNYLSDSMVRAPSGVYNAIEVDTYAGGDECAARGVVVSYSWRNFADNRPNDRGGFVLGTCWPMYYTPTYNLWTTETCNGTHRISAICNDAHCSDCSVMASQSTKFTFQSGPKA